MNRSGKLMDALPGVDPRRLPRLRRAFIALDSRQDDASLM
jgi:hypothetical protein